MLPLPLLLLLMLLLLPPLPPLPPLLALPPPLRVGCAFASTAVLVPRPAAPELSLTPHCIAPSFSLALAIPIATTRVVQIATIVRSSFALIAATIAVDPRRPAVRQCAHVEAERAARVGIDRV